MHRAAVALAALIVSACTAPPQNESAVAPLPFDTTGAGRGTPLHVLTAPNARLLGGDTLVFANEGVDESRPGANIMIRVFATDTSARRMRMLHIDLAPCPFELRLYDTPRRDAQPVWTSSHARKTTACPPSTKDADATSAIFHIDTIVGTSLGGRRYWLRYAVRLKDGRVLEYIGREDTYIAPTPVTTTSDRSSLRFTSGSELTGAAPRMLRAWATMRNSGTQAVRFGYGECALQIRLWRNAERSGQPVWLSERRQPIPRRGSKERAGYACAMWLGDKRLMPNDTMSFDLSVPFPEVLNDSLPDGQYWVGVELTLGNDKTKYNFPAGELALRRASDPQPSVRQEGPLRIEAATRLIRGKTPDSDTVRAFILVTNTSDDSADVVVQRGKAVALDGFRSAAERDQYPTPTPTYTSQLGGYVIGPQRFSLGRGQKWLFETSVSAKDIVARAGKGRVYFLASLLGEPTIKLAAGDVDLR